MPTVLNKVPRHREEEEMAAKDPNAIGQDCTVCLCRLTKVGKTEDEVKKFALITEKQPGVVDEECPDGGYRHVDCFW